MVKAIAIKGSNKSVVATASYTFGHKVTTIAAALALADGEVARFDGKVVAVYQYSSNLYVTDEAGDYALIYGSLGKTYSNGDVVPVGFYGTKKLFNGLTEFEAEASSFAASTEAESAVSPKTVKVSDVTTAIQNHYVRIEGVTLDPTDKTITDATGSLAFYNSFKVTLPSASATGSVEGIVSIYNNLQLLPIVFSEGTSVDMADADAVRIEAGRGVIEVRGSAASIAERSSAAAAPRRPAPASTLSASAAAPPKWWSADRRPCDDKSLIHIIIASIPHSDGGRGLRSRPPFFLCSASIAHGVAMG